MRTSFETPQQTVLKAEVDGDLVGFFIVEHRSDRSVYWHLTAVAPGWQGKGMGIEPVADHAAPAPGEGATSVETTISGHNAAGHQPVCAGWGSRSRSAQMTFHWLETAVDDGSVGTAVAG